MTNSTYVTGTDNDVYHLMVEKFPQQQQRIKALREALEEIRDVARVSEGVEFYAMLAEKALTNDEEENQ
tara:strand:+ start:199 stop:405 length:207 start_codon:yes stop_codon:yes gene_type:complete